MRKMLVLLMLIPAMLLCSCSESEPLASGESRLSDVEWDASEIAEYGWPAELLPAGFPEAPYSEIYSVERKDNEVVIIMFAEWDLYDTTNARTQFVDTLMDDGYVIYREGDAAFSSLLSEEGLRVRFSDTADPSSHLQSIESPTGYTYEIRVSKIDVGDDLAYLFWEYPSQYTDLGLEEMTFDEWPKDYLPDGFPRPDEEPNTDLKIISMEQKKTGVFITIEGTNIDLITYEQNLYYNYGYMNNGNILYYNNNEDYVYVYGSSANGGGRNDVNQWTFQINKCNEYVIKETAETTTASTADVTQ